MAEKTSSSSVFASVLIASLAAESSRKKPRLSFTNQRRQLCPHCNQNLSMKTLKKNKRLYCTSDGSWVDTKSTQEMYESEFVC